MASLYPPHVAAQMSGRRPLPSVPAPVVAPRRADIPRHRVLSSFMPRSNHSLPLTTLQIPSILASFIAFLDWSDVYNLLSACKTFREIFSDMALRDVVLARFVSGYALCLRHRDMQFYQDIPVSVHDLDLLLISQRADLHRYPTHALRTMTSLFPTFEQEQMTAKLVALTQAHSRFVLLLQSLVHSSSKPMPLEPEETKTKIRFSPVQSLRELIFPAPLAYTQPRASDSGTATTMSRHKHHKHSRSADSKYINGEFGLNAGRLNSFKKLERSGSRPSASSLSSMMAMSSISNEATTPIRKQRRLSIFGKNSTNIRPPPPEEPRTLKIYSNTWRRNSVLHSRSGSNLAQGYGYLDTDETGFMAELKHPQRRFANTSSSDSSLSARSSIAGRDSPQSAASRMTSSSLSSSGSPSPPPLPSLTLHDLRSATSRTRAPVLRVFVPSSDEALDGCERQLQDSGLWEYLSTGDVICNFGYVPPTIEEGSAESEDPSMMDGGLMMKSKSSNYHNQQQRKWLLFDGLYLVPYSPPDVLPLEDPLSLPSPFYYSHIMPNQPPASSLSLSPTTNPTFMIKRLPVCDDVPQLTLVRSTTKVPSPHSLKGFAVVNKYAWTARVVRLRPAPGSGAADESEMGEGWFGEWVLEYDGTKEGKQVLLDALAGKKMGRRVWELVREKSGRGKVWLRLLPQ